MKKGLVVIAAAVTLYAGTHHGLPANVAGAGASPGRGTAGSNETLANSMAASYGWTGSEVTCLDELWTEESGFSSTALNSSSGAYGIPQSLPASKMAAAGPDWRTNPSTQVKWGLGYIHDVYGTPCAAWAHEKSTNPNWY